MKKLLSLTIILTLAFLSTTAFAGHRLTFQWDHDGQDVAGFRIYASLISGTYSFPAIIDITYEQAAQPEPYTATTDFTSYEGETTWYFVATAYDAEGNESGYSNEVSCVIVVPDTTPPGDPTNFSVTIEILP